MRVLIALQSIQYKLLSPYIKSELEYINFPWGVFATEYSSHALLSVKVKTFLPTLHHDKNVFCHVFGFVCK